MNRRAISPARALIPAALAVLLLAPLEAGAGSWAHNIGLGLNLNRGDADSLHSSLTLDGRRKRDSNLLRYALSGSYGRTDGAVSRERLAGRADYSRDLSERLFWSTGFSGETDRVGGIDYLLDTHAGLGWYLLRTEVATFTVQPGLAWVFRRYRDDESENYPAFQLAQGYERRLAEKGRFWQAARYLPRIDDSWGDFLLGLEAGVSAPLGEISSLRLVLENLYHSRPAAGKTRNNLSLVAYLAWKI